MSVTIDVSKINNFKDYMAQPVDTGKIASPAKFKDSVVDLFCGEKSRAGASLPFTACEGNFRFRPGECTIWAGQNGAGKSSLLTMCALHWLNHRASIVDEKILVISPEMTPEQNLGRLVRQMLCKHPDDMGPEEIRQAMSEFEGRLWVYNHVGSVAVDVLRGIMRYAVRELGVTQIIFDNITILKFDGDPLREQKHFITDMVEISRDENVHIHVVAHSRKPEAGAKRMTKLDIRGASEQSDLVDNVILISRNEAKEEKKRHLDPSSEEYREVNKQADTRFDIAKQRHGDGWVGMVRLWFYPKAMRWSDNEKMAPKKMSIG